MDNSFIGRYDHIKELKKALSIERKMLIPIIGRRGIGKTTLLNKFKQKSFLQWKIKIIL